MAAAHGHGKRRGHQDEGHVNHERWLLTYADLITLLMVLFVVMYSMSRADTAKFAKLQAALQRAFRIDVLKGMDQSSLQGEDGFAEMKTMIAEAVTQPKPVSQLDGKLINTLEELREELRRLPIPAGTMGGVSMGTTRDGVVISMAGNLFFDSGRADLKPEGLIFLDTLVEQLRGMPNEFRVEGHTDDTPIATSLYPTNWELSSARATTVARYFVERGGIAPNRVVAAGYAEYRPVASNAEREGRARNRRVDVVILYSPVTPAAPQPLAPGRSEGSRGDAHSEPGGRGEPGDGGSPAAEAQRPESHTGESP